MAGPTAISCTAADRTATSAIATIPPASSPKCHPQNDQVEFEKATALLFLIGDVDSRDQTAHAARRAPQCQQQAHNGGETERPARCLDQIAQFLPLEFLRLRRKDAGEGRYLSLDLSRVENEPAEGNERR